MNKGLKSEHILLKLCESFFLITNGQLVCKMAQAQMCLSAYIQLILINKL
jgi:hypothetical protein